MSNLRRMEIVNDEDGGYEEDDPNTFQTPLASSPHSRDIPSPYSSSNSWMRRPLDGKIEEFPTISNTNLLHQLNQSDGYEEEDENGDFLDENDPELNLFREYSLSPPLSSSTNSLSSSTSMMPPPSKLRTSRSNSEGQLFRRRNVLEDATVARKVVSLNHEYEEGEEPPNKGFPLVGQSSLKRDPNFYSIVYDKTDDGEDFNSSNDQDYGKSEEAASIEQNRREEEKRREENLKNEQKKLRLQQNNDIVVPDVDTRGLAEDEVKLYQLTGSTQNQVNQLIEQVKQLINDKSLLLSAIKRDKRNVSQHSSPMQMHSSAPSPVASPRTKIPVENSHSEPNIIITDNGNYMHSPVSMSHPSYWTDEKMSLERDNLALIMKNVMEVQTTLSSLHKATTQRMVAIQQAQFGSVRNWNGQFQEILDLPQIESLERVYRFDRISQLANDFEHTAITYGKIIISEASLPITQKTVKPVSIGGQAGGEKYIHAGILFKFALDWKGIYGGDEYCMKAASNELKGLSRYFSCGVGLCVPLMTLIDYMGYRLIAMSILPIARETLCYGSMDFGRSLATPTEECNDMMEKAAVRLNLKKHMAGIEGNQPISAPVDIEVHLGKDKRYYLIDAARTFCPTTPEKGVRACYLYKLFRPEFVKTNPIPLSSDAFAPVDRFDPERLQHRQDVIEATNRLLLTVIPEFATFLDNAFERNQQNVFSKMKTLQKTFVHDLHRAGINIRYIGIVRTHSKNPFIRRFLMMEMIARSIKNLLRAELRLVSRTQNSQAIEPYKRVVLHLFNLIINGQSSSLHTLPREATREPGAPQVTTRYVFGDQDDAVDFWRDQLEPALKRNFLLFPSTQQLEAELEAEKGDTNIMVHKCIISGVCTFNVTGESYIEQPFYNCFTCGLLEDLGCCIVCAQVCHKGHNISATQKLSKFFCDCQLQGHCKISERGDKELEAPRANKNATNTPSTNKREGAEDLIAYRMRSLSVNNNNKKQEDVGYGGEYGEGYGYGDDDNSNSAKLDFERPREEDLEEKFNGRRRNHLKKAEIIRNNSEGNIERKKGEKGKKEAEEEEEEKEPEHILKYIVRSSLGFAKLFKRVAKISGVEISSYCKRSLKKHGENFVFVDADIKEFIVRSRPMDFIAAAEANAFALRASLESGSVMATSNDSITSSMGGWDRLSNIGKGNNPSKYYGKKVSRMFTLSQSKFEQALNASPDSRETIETYAGFLLDQAFRSAPIIEWSLLSQAMSRYKDIEKLDIIIQSMERAKEMQPWAIEYFTFQKETWKMILESPSLTKRGKTLKSMDLTELPLSVENCNSIVNNFDNLTTLSMADTRAKVNSVQVILNKLTNLTNLDISGLASSEKEVNASEELSFANQKELLHLNITRCGMILIHLGKGTPKLQSLVAAFTATIAYKQTLHAICKNCPELVKLMLNGFVPLTDRGVKPIVRYAKNLKVLGLSSITLSREAYTQLANSLTKLEEIHIERSDNFDDECLASFLGNCKDVRVINIPFCINISRNVLTQLDKLKTPLVSLRISGNLNINNNTIFSITKTYPTITILDISHCQALTWAAVASIAKHLTQLAHLNLSHCPRMNDQAVDSLKSLSSLLTINLSGTSISDESILCVLEHFPALIGLIINNCQGISYPPVKRLVSEKSSLQLFICQKCNQISLEGLRDVRPLLFGSTSRIVYDDAWYTQETDYYMVAPPPVDL